ncbi:MAG: hypothetical protein ACTHV8_06670 [Nesterenkonia sp.]
MSIEALNYAVRVGDRLGEMQKKRITPTEALLLLHLCNHVDGQWRWQSDKKKLARRCITSPRTIQTALGKFQDWGLITVKRSYGHRGQDAEGFEFWVHEESLKGLAEAPEQFFADFDSRVENISTPGNSRSENSSDLENNLWITGSENSSTPGNTGEENSSTLPGSEIYAGSDVENFHPQRVRASFKPSREPSNSSSSGPRKSRPCEPVKEPPASAVGEEEPLPGADRGEGRAGVVPAASGGDTNPAETRPPVEGYLGVGDTDEIQQLLAAVDSEPVTDELTEAYIALVLGRASEKAIGSPAKFVAASIRRNPERTTSDLTKLRSESASPTGTGRPGGQGSSKSDVPVLCALPEHRSRGRQRSNCPECRGITGEFEFPVAVSQTVFDQLADWQKRNLLACGVEVRDHVDEATMLRSLPHRRQRPVTAGQRRAGAAA